MHELTQFQAQAATVALNKLLYGQHFSICDLDKLGKLLGVELGGKDYEAMHGLHCVNWGDMPAQLRTQAREKVVELLGLPPLVIEGEKAAPEAAHKEPERKLRLAFWK
jgi:hypothetical protein